MLSDGDGGSTTTLITSVFINWILVELVGRNLPGEKCRGGGCQGISRSCIKSLQPLNCDIKKCFDLLASEGTICQKMAIKVLQQTPPGHQERGS